MFYWFFEIDFFALFHLLLLTKQVVKKRQRTTYMKSSDIWNIKNNEQRINVKLQQHKCWVMCTCTLAKLLSFVDNGFIKYSSAVQRLKRNWSNLRFVVFAPRVIAGWKRKGIFAKRRSVVQTQFLKPEPLLF